MVRSLIVVAALLIALMAIAGSGDYSSSSTVLIGPVNDSLVYTYHPYLIWHSDSDAGSGDTLQYEFHLATDSAFANCVASGRLADTTTGLWAYLYPGLRYSWRVVTRDTLGQVTESAIETFRTYLPGDMNASMTVTSSDIIALVGYVFKGDTLEVAECAGNVNSSMYLDTVVNSADVVTLINYVFRGGDLPRGKCPEEFWPFGDWKPLHGDLRVFAYEPHRTNQGGDVATLSFWLETTWDSYPCANYEIQLDFDSSGQSLNHRLHGALLPGVCLTSPGPAYWSTDLTLDTGVYVLTYERCQWQDHLQLTLTDSYVLLSHLDSHFTEIVYPLRWRRPYKSMCVSCYMPAAVSWVCGAFLDSLHANLVLSDYQFPDSGLVPYGLYEHPSFFLYANESVYDSALVVFDSFVQNVLAGMSEYPYMRIHLDNWDGRYVRLPYLVTGATPVATQSSE